MEFKFVGKSVDVVTGSSVLVKLDNNKKVLIDCGGHQSSNIFNDYEINSANFPFKPTEIDYCVISHIHSDHQSLASKLINNGFKGKFIITEGMKFMFARVLRDSHHVLSKQLEYIQKTKPNTKEIYTEEDVDNVISNTIEYPFYKHIELYNGVVLELLPNAHLAGSCQISIREKKTHSKLVYSGDLGNIRHDNPYVEEFAPVKNCTVYISECTYGERSKDILPVSRANDIEYLRQIIERTSGTILIPCFSLSRTQTILKTLYDMKIDIPVIVDSPLSVAMTMEYNYKYNMGPIMEWDKLTLVSDWAESLGYHNNTNKKIVLSAPGMLDSYGRSYEHLKYIIGNENCAVVFVGYNSEGTIGRKLYDGHKVVRIEEEDTEVKCSIYKLQTFGSHMQRKELLTYLSSINCNNVFLHHGNKLGKEQLKEDLEECIYNELKTTKVNIPKYNEWYKVK